MSELKLLADAELDAVCGGNLTGGNGGNGGAGGLAANGAEIDQSSYCYFGHNNVSRNNLSVNNSTANANGGNGGAGGAATVNR